MESFPEDHSDGFDHLDATGSGIDGLVCRFYGDTSDLHEAPCGKCRLDCPGTIGPCLLNEDSGALLGMKLREEGLDDSEEDYYPYAEAA
jgi:hypothetical protein